jgi:molybdopterin converting factor small subunit
MQIHVQLFSILRDCIPPDAGRGQASIALPEGATLADLVAHLGVDQRLGHPATEVVSKAGWQVLVSGGYEPDMGRVLQDGDQVRIFPPVAGG